MLAEQDGLCAICQEAEAAHVDHDHATGRVRGMLCFNCNGALGQFRDRPDLMLRAVDYLSREEPGRFLPVPAELIGYYVGPIDTGRPAHEPRFPSLPGEYSA